VKAKIVQQTVYESMVTKSHGFGRNIKRLVVEEAENLAITPDQGRVFVWINFDVHADDSCKVIGEVDVPDELVRKALALAHAQTELNGLEDTFNKLLVQTT